MMLLCEHEDQKDLKFFNSYAVLKLADISEADNFSSGLQFYYGSIHHCNSLVLAHVHKHSVILIKRQTTKVISPEMAATLSLVIQFTINDTCQLYY